MISDRSFQFAATLAVFAATMVLVIRRPRGWSEAVWSCLGAGALLALGLETPRAALAVLLDAREPLLFLAALLILSALLERSGFFEWAAVLAARRAGGQGRVLYRNVFVLGALVTALLSLDTTAVILTPIVLAFVRRLKLPARPFVFACAFIANTASLPLPVSNLTNLVFSSAFHFQFAVFALRMGLATIVAVSVNYWLFSRLFARELPARFDAASLPIASSMVAHRGYFRVAVGVLAASSVAYFVSSLIHVPPYVIGFIGCAVLALAGVRAGRVDRALPGEIAWSIFPFVIGLFIIVRAVGRLGIGDAAAALVAALPRAPLLGVPAAALVATAASNAVNNLPAALLLRDALLSAHAPTANVYGALLGTNIGPNIVVVGSLATMLVLGRARAQGDAPSNGQFLLVGLRVTPWLLLAASLTLALTFVAWS